MWTTIAVGTFGQPGMEFHLVPVEDLRAHEAENCWCRPERDDEQPSVFTHHSMDGREAFESGERLMS